MRAFLMVGVAALVAGCSGIEPGKTYPTESFVVPIGYQEAYRRAQAHGHECLSTFDTRGDLYTDNRTGVVRVSIPKFMYTGKESLRTEIRASGDQATEVRVIADNVGVFDARQIKAVRASIESGKPICR